jgi:hypothetical protein
MRDDNFFPEREPRLPSGRRDAARDPIDLDDLLHPARAFEHPMKVVADPDLTLSEKRAILASWASDACAVEAAPALRQAPGAGQPVCFDDIMDALRVLDQQAQDRYRPKPRYRRVLERRVPRMFGRKRPPSDGHDPGPAAL